MRFAQRTTCTLLLLSVVGGCSAPPRGGAAAPPPLEPPTYSDLAAAHNRRVAMLQQTYAYGVLELRWEDERGVHSEPQVDIEMWLDLPARTAVHVDKLGEDLFWIGSDEHNYWVFDLLEKDDRLALIASREDERAVESIAYFGLQPDSLLDLMALRPIPATVDGVTTVEDAPEHDAWLVAGLGERGRTFLYFDRATWRPVRVELRSADGDVLLESTLSRYESVAMRGTNPLNFPRQAMWIDIVDRAGGGFAKIHLNEMTADVADQPFDRVFDLDRLLRALRPDRVEGQPAPRVAGSRQ